MSTVNRLTLHVSDMKFDISEANYLGDELDLADRSSLPNLLCGTSALTELSEVKYLF
jgi:hypothetical protein